MKKPKLKKLKNGLSVMTIETDSPSVTVMSLVNTGSWFENKKKNGISHFLEHMCFKGTQNHNGKEIMRYLDGLGAETNAFTSFEYTGYYVKSITKHWKKTLAIVADIFQHSTFPKEEIEKEKGVIAGEISMYKDMPMRKVGDNFMQLVYGDQPAGRTILGSPETVSALYQDDFVQYHENHYVADNSIVVISGKVQHPEVIAQVQKHFSEMKATKKSPRKKTRTDQQHARIDIQHKKTDQTHIVYGFPTAGIHHKDAAALRLLAAIMGGGMSSRLFEKLREDMGVGYYVHAGASLQTDTGTLQIACGVDSKRVPEVLAAISSICNNLRTEQVSPKELLKTQEYIIGNTNMSLEATDDAAYYYGKKALVGINIETPAAFARKIKSLSPQDIKRVAKKYLKDSKINIAIVGPHTANAKKSFRESI